MPRIVDVMQDLGLGQEEFAKAYEAVVGKKLTAKTQTLSDANLEKLKSHLGKWAKSSAEAKVLKTDEIWFGGGFLSGLGFSHQADAPAKPAKEEKKISNDNDLAAHGIMINAPKEEKPVKEERISIENLNTERYEARKVSSAPERPVPVKKQGGNISIGQSTYKSKEKVIAPATDFSKFQEKPESSVVKLQDIQKHLDQNQKVEKKSDSRKADTPKHVEPKKPEPKPTPAAKQHKEATTSANLVKKSEVVIDDAITVKEFSEKIGVPLPEVMKKLMLNGIMSGLNANLDFDTASLIAEDLGVSLKK